MSLRAEPYNLLIFVRDRSPCREYIVGLDLDPDSPALECWCKCRPPRNTAPAVGADVTIH